MPMDPNPATPPPGPLPVGSGFRLPRQQERTWFVDQLSTLPGGYLIPVFLRFLGELDEAALCRAVLEIVSRHEVLRTSVRIAEDTPVGVLRPASDLSIPVLDLDPARLTEFMERESREALDVDADLPIRAGLLRLGSEDHVLYLAIHHMAFDDWSQGILYQEIESLYRAFHAGEPSPLPALPAQYREVAQALDAEMDEGRTAGQLAFWRETLAGHEPFELTPDRPRPRLRDGRGASRRVFTLPAALTAQLAELGRPRGATLATVLMAACQTVLHRYSGRTDLTVGTTSGVRSAPEAENLIGLFVNMLPIRGDLAGDPPFSELVARLHEVALDAYDHADLPFDRLVEEFAPERDLSRTPLFQVLVNFGARGHDGLRLPGLTFTELHPEGTSAKYDLGIGFTVDEGGLVCEIGWDTALYDAAVIDRLAGHLRMVLEHVARSPETRIGAIALMSADEEAELRALATTEPTTFPALCLHELFELQAARTPQAVAIVDDVTSWSYAELNERSDVIAGCLRERGVRPESPVGVLLDRSPELVAALLGVLKAGGAYLPIEPGTPAARIVELLGDSGAAVCLVGPGDQAEVVRAACTPLTIEACFAEPRRPPLTDPAPDPDGLCSIYYTSGSTGKPKGVASTHAGWVNRMSWMQDRHRLALGERVLFKTTLTFDDSAVELFWPLMVGGTVAVLPPGDHRDPWAIVAAAIRFQAVHVNFVPSVLELVLDTLSPEDVAGLRRLRSVLSSGEALRAPVVRRFRETFGDRVSLDNTWGATEVSIDSTFRTCTAADAEGDGIVGLGIPMANNEVLVLDSALRPVPLGVSGELCIAGIGLARGYLGDPAKTAEAFVPHPWRPGRRIYRTGDQGRTHGDGSLEFGGRLDDQVKIRGVRIELGEIDAALLAAPGVADAASVIWQGPDSEKRLAAYVVFPADTGTTIDSVYASVRGRLTGYAVPGTIRRVPQIPRFASGKLDRRALPSPAAATPRRQDQDAAEPRGAAETVVADVFTAVLGIGVFSVHDNFFTLGGHSLLVIRVINRLRQAFGLDLALSLLFENPTVATLAARIEERLRAEVESLSDTEAERLLAT